LFYHYNKFSDLYQLAQITIRKMDIGCFGRIFEIFGEDAEHYLRQTL